jgi:hypothetical protein
LESIKLEMKDYYVTLTGGKNNAGDFLIKHRAFELLRWLRPDRQIIDYNAWEKITPEKLQVINESRALILLGGPALRKDMFPGIYNIDEPQKIEVPVISMAIGWKSVSGEWRDSRKYPLHPLTIELVKSANVKGIEWGVRDYPSWNALSTKGLDGVTMTGCAALYSREHLHTNIQLSSIDKIRSVSFSLGVGFRNDPKLDAQQKQIILKLRKMFSHADFTAVFHHGIGDNYSSSDGASKELLRSHQQLAEWLKENAIKFVDISGSADYLIRHYEQTDLHIGYRVHAHIFMSSISKLSVLINEDGRGKALSQVIPGLYFDSFESVRPNQTMLNKIKTKLLRSPVSKYNVSPLLPAEIVSNLKYEFQHQFPRMSRTRKAIDDLFPTMEKFISQLP